MDDPTVIIAEVLQKLADFNKKVYDYREDMANQFRQHSENLLRDAPKHLVARVEQALADELHKYEALGPALASDTASADLDRPSADPWPRRGRVSPPPVLPHTSGVPPNDGSPPDRNREREFHGLFTPSYLPLLEVVQPIQPISKPAAVLPPAMSRDNESNDSQEPPSPVQLDTVAQQPDLVRQYTEDTISSITSDDSVSRIRRSALRRSSSASTKDGQSLRRVRFEVEGEEVLPTVSPPISPRIHDLPTSPSPEDEAMPIHESLNHTVFDEEDSILGSSPPRPKKISSTERLKALARSSTEDTSKWTVVGDMHDDDEEEDGLVMSTSKKKPSAVSELAPVTLMGSDTDFDHMQDEQLKTITKETNDEQDVGQDVDDILELPPLASFKDKKTFSPPEEVQKTIQEVRLDENSNSKKSLLGEPISLGPAPLQLPGARKLEEEEVFKFDDDEPALKLANAKYIKDDELEEEEETAPLVDSSVNEPAISLYSTSPAIPIIRPGSLRSKQAAASVGSYKGKPFIIGVVRDELVHQQAAEMGDVPVFVGSVDGRSGVDASDSYRYFNSALGSIGERLMVEANARRQKEDENDNKT
ncbi:hypothetical protein GGR51DRAFT_569757 [Nemania sp. FL0031]|nr:hypothetical protein GGR51DRAFT_569757 [Nemania sp. FL0031]